MTDGGDMFLRIFYDKRKVRILYFLVKNKTLEYSIKDLMKKLMTDNPDYGVAISNLYLEGLINIKIEDRGNITKDNSVVSLNGENPIVQKIVELNNLMTEKDKG